MPNEINQPKSTRVRDNATDQKKVSDSKTNQEREKFHKDLLSKPSGGQGHDPYSGLSASDKTKMNDQIVNGFATTIKEMLEESRAIEQPNSESPMTVGDLEKYRRENSDHILAEQLAIQERQEQIDDDYQFARNFSITEAITMPPVYKDITKPSDIVFKNDMTVYMMQSQESAQSSDIKSIEDIIDGITANDLYKTIQDIKQERDDAIYQDIRNKPNSNSSEIFNITYKSYEDTLEALESIHHQLSHCESRSTKSEKEKEIFLEDIKRKYYDKSTSTDDNQLINPTLVRTAIEAVKKFNLPKESIVVDYTKLVTNDNDFLLTDIRRMLRDNERKRSDNDSIKEYLQKNIRKINKILEANEYLPYPSGQEPKWLNDTEFDGATNKAVISLIESLKTPPEGSFLKKTSDRYHEYAVSI